MLTPSQIGISVHDTKKLDAILDLSSKLLSSLQNFLGSSKEFSLMKKVLGSMIQKEDLNLVKINFAHNSGKSINLHIDLIDLGFNVQDSVALIQGYKRLNQAAFLLPNLPNPASFT